MADEKFRRPKWCTAPRSPERHKQLVRAVGGEVGNGASYAPERCTVGELRKFRMDRLVLGWFFRVKKGAPSPVSCIMTL